MGARQQTVSRTTQDLQKTASTYFQRVSVVLEEKITAWRSSMSREYRMGADRMLGLAQDFVTQIIAALEVFVSTGLGGSGPFKAAKAGSGKAMRRFGGRGGGGGGGGGGGTRFDAFEVESEEDEASGRGQAGDGDEEDEEDDDGNHLARMLRRMYELTLEVFSAWERCASMVIRVNGYGMHRADQKVMSTLQPLRTEFESLVKAQGVDVMNVSKP
jgi:hypothetical protein